MYNIIPLIIILLSLAAIMIVIVRKFSVLANLDIESMPAEKEAKVKEVILGNRLKRNFFKYFSLFMKIARPVGNGVVGSFKYLFNKLVEFKDNTAAPELPLSKLDDRVARLFMEADEALKKNELEQAEKKYIDIISLDSQNVKAFSSLGDLYCEKKQFSEAKETFEHALRLAEKSYEDYVLNAQTGDSGNKSDNDTAKDGVNIELASIHYELARVAKCTGRNEEAAKGISQALAIEPNNPRYLDMKLEISIINKDKEAALEAYDRLSSSNPDNKKLEDFKQQISKLDQAANDN